MNNLRKINIDDIQPGLTLGQADAAILRDELRELLARRVAAEINPCIGYVSKDAVMRMVEGKSRFCSVYPEPEREYKLAVYLDRPFTAPPLPVVPAPEIIEGMEVSIDVSTCDADAGHRYFGTVTEVSELDGAKHGYILLVQDAKPNFTSVLPVVPDEMTITQAKQRHSGTKEMIVSFADGYNACRAETLNGGNSPVAPDGWIPVSERFPDVGDVVMTAINGCVNVGLMERSGAAYRYFTSVISGRELPATHWMPMPEAPKPGGDNA